VLILHHGEHPPGRLKPFGCHLRPWTALLGDLTRSSSREVSGSSEEHSLSLSSLDRISRYSLPQEERAASIPALLSSARARALAASASAASPDRPSVLQGPPLL
jgi:hypothetical protein